MVSKTGKPIATAVAVESPSPMPVLVAEGQQPIPVTIMASDGAVPGTETSTPPVADTPIPQGQPTGTPVNMTVMAPRPTPPTVTKGEGTTLSPTTTEEQDVTTAGQRKINIIWEKTQSWIALMVVISGVVVNTLVILTIIFLGKEVSVTQLSLISISLQFVNLTTGIVIGFYFSRTNHSAQGGIGPKTEYPYTGR